MTDGRSVPSSSSGDAAPSGPSPAERRTAHLFVVGQLAAVTALLAAPRRHDRPGGPVRAVAGGLGVLAGGGLMVVGGAALGRGLTPVPLPNERAELRTDGPYRLVRHPLYTGLLLAAGSVAAASGSVPRRIACAVLLGVITAKARWEEQHLTRRFPGYAAYAARTPRFVPRLRAVPGDA